MKSETSSLAERFAEVLNSGTWVAGTNIQSEIESLTYEIATKRFESLNSIADLVYHLTYYLKGMQVVLRDKRLNMRDADSFSDKTLPNAEAWEELKHQYAQAASILIEEIKNLSDEQLQAPFVDPKYGTLVRNLEAQIEHSYYHLGQIVLIKRLLGVGR